MGVGAIERLTDLIAEIEPAIKMDVGQRKALAADIFAPVGHLAIKPFQPVLRDHLQYYRAIDSLTSGVCVARKVAFL